jgi:phosphohistidine phosphatase
MKSLLIMRHGKSSWKEAGLTDHERPLSKRGRKDAPRMGELLNEERIIPELVLTSSAKRARDTAEAAVDASGYIPEVRHLPGLYQADADSYINALHRLPADIDRVMVVGHNPDLEELVYTLTGESFRMPTCALVHVSLPINTWADLDDETEGKLVDSWLPKEL